MRLFALGQAWSEGIGPVELIVREAPESVLDRYASEGFAVRRMSKGPSRSSIETLATMLREDARACAAVDLPEVSASELDILGDSRARSLLVDDMAALESYPVALVLNQNAHASRASYPRDAGAGFLLGLEYVVLRREFRTLRHDRVIPGRARRILVTFGGADPTGMTRRTVDALADIIDLNLDVRVIIGAAYPDLHGLESAIIQRSSLSLNVMQHVDDMISHMLWADLAVTSGGSTVWELARTGCPAVVVETAPAEHLLATGLERVELFDRLGPADALTDSGLRAAIERRILDATWRGSMARRGPMLIDGHGAGRVIDALSSLVAP